jgi:hypothetical protein
MLNPKVAKLADERIQIQLNQRHKQFRQEITRVTDQMTLQGTLDSTIANREFFNRYASEIETRASIVWEELKKVLSAIDVHPSEELASHLKQDVETYLLSTANDLTKDISKLANYIMNTQEIDNLIDKLTNTQNKALERINNGIELFVLSLGRTKEKEVRDESTKNIINGTGNVGAVQTGQGATSNVTQIISSNDQEALFQALDDIRKYLESGGNLSGFLKEEVIELIDDSRAEIEKPNPNGTRLKTYLMSIAVSIQTVAGLKPAYEVIKFALSHFHIILP